MEPKASYIEANMDPNVPEVRPEAFEKTKNDDVRKRSAPGRQP